MEDNEEYIKIPKIHANTTLPLKHIRGLKALRGVSYSDLAKQTKLGYSREYFHKVLKGHINPPSRVKQALGNFFQVDPLMVQWGITDEVEK